MHPVEDYNSSSGDEITLGPQNAGEGNPAPDGTAARDATASAQVYCLIQYYELDIASQGKCPFIREIIRCPTASPDSWVCPCILPWMGLHNCLAAR